MLNCCISLTVGPSGMAFDRVLPARIPLGAEVWPGEDPLHAQHLHAQHLHASRTGLLETGYGLVDTGMGDRRNRIAGATRERGLDQSALHETRHDPLCRRGGPGCARVAALQRGDERDLTKVNVGSGQAWPAITARL